MRRAVGGCRRPPSVGRGRRHHHGRLRRWPSRWLAESKSCGAPGALLVQARVHLLRVRVALGADLSMAECNKLIQALDEDGTDSLDFNEFLRFHAIYISVKFKDLLRAKEQAGVG